VGEDFRELVGVDAEVVEGRRSGEAGVGFGGEVGWVAFGGVVAWFVSVSGLDQRCGGTVNLPRRQTR
jgi:hypothetical protein